MTVQELINALSKVEDQSLEVVFPYDYGVNENNQPLAVKEGYRISRLCSNF